MNVVSNNESLNGCRNSARLPLQACLKKSLCWSVDLSWSSVREASGDPNSLMICEGVKCRLQLGSGLTLLRDSARFDADAFTDATGRSKDAASGIAGLSGQASGLSQLQQALEQQGIGFMFDVGTKEQAQNQAVLDAERMSETEDLYEPYKRLSFVSDIYAGAPSGSMTTVEGGGSGNEPSLFEKLFGTAVGVSSSAAGIQSLFG